jgi:GTP-binding protein
VIDCAGYDARDPVEDWRALRKEVRLYDAELAKRPTLLVANKMDLPGAEDGLARLEKAARRKAVPISASTGEGIPALLTKMRKAAGVKPPAGAGVKAVKAAPPPAEADGGHAEVSAEKFARATFLSI